VVEELLIIVGLGAALISLLGLNFILQKLMCDC